MYTLPSILAICVALASGREYRLRTPPSVSHSIVNLGKMEFNVYLNPDSKPSVPETPPSELTILQQPTPMQSLRESGECPCNRRRHKQEPLSPSDMLTKILLNNDLFKDPTMSSLCCSSHEQIQEEVVMEFHPKPIMPQSLRQNIPVAQNWPPVMPQVIHDMQIPSMPLIPVDKTFQKPLQFLPLIFDSFNKGNQKKPKTLEIILIPTRKPTAKPTPPKRSPSTADIQVVGDKKTTMVYDMLAANSSVKKDLKQDAGEHLTNMDTDKSTVTIQNNTL